jgi:ABC-type multidrug transport system fused ATPase/permease subunit
MDKVDLDLSQSIGQGMSTTFSVLGAIGAIVTATKGTFLIPLIPIGYIYWIIQKWFRKTSTELQRVTSVSGSPIFSDFSQVLSGTSTIRAFSEQGRFFRQCQNSFDNFNSSYNLTYMCNYWLGLRLDFLGGLIGFFIGAVAVGTAEMNFIPAGWLGLALSYSIEVTGFLKHGVRMIATIEADMNSVERILYYSEKVDPEAPDFVPEMDPPTGTWPSDGKIEVTNGSMRYRDGPLVLKSISVDIRGGEKIGVVGRTGSGKSSLMNVLFRITELEKNGGVVKIDGIDISQIGTDALRSNISIIPQDPVMFSNSVRYNIDPFGSSTVSTKPTFSSLLNIHLTFFSTPHRTMKYGRYLRKSNLRN